MTITTNIVSAVKVQFIKPIFEDDFVEKGMTAWLTDVEWNAKTGCYHLYFDFTDFEDINAKYFKRVFHPNRYTANVPNAEGRRLFTAQEAGMYDAKYTVFFTCGDDVDKRDDEAFARDIVDYLREVD